MGSSRVYLCHLVHPPRIEQLVRQQGCSELHSWSQLQWENACSRDNAFRCLPASEKTPPGEEINEWQVWAFSEITASLILDDPKFQMFWPNSPILSNYPQLAALRPKLKSLFDQRASYVDYEDKSVPLLQAFDPRNPVP